MTEQQKPETEAAPEPSAFEKAVTAMSPEQLANVSAVLAAEHAKRDDPMQRLGSLSDREFFELKDQAFRK